MIDLRALTTPEEFREAVALQKSIWGFADIELLPARLFVVASKIGGQVYGAYDGTRMIAFCLAIPGLKPGGRFYLHSHMLGVDAKYRNAGVGRLLKLKQRENAIAREIELIEWTFDPLEIKNAWFNMERLGAIVRRYVHNQYGTTSSALHGGLPTDRCTAEWWVSSRRVNAILEQRERAPEQVEMRVSVQANISDIRMYDRARARRIQIEVGKQLEDGFAKGLAVIGFEKSADAGIYLLGKLP